jgi:YebC/PmpR family DNA-binding regulatory protein
MSGHNKWSKIKNKKAVTDAQKSKLFSKFARLIAAESKRVGGDTSSPTLRVAIEKARAANMPSDNIDRAVKKGASDDATTMESVLYEAYGPGGVALIIEGLTDNRNRTGPEIKHLLTTHGATLAEPGSALWAFEKTADGFTATTTIPLSPEDGEKLGALLDELEEHDDIHEVSTNAA